MWMERPGPDVVPWRSQRTGSSQSESRWSDSRNHFKRQRYTISQYLMWKLNAVQNFLAYLLQKVVTGNCCRTKGNSVPGTFREFCHQAVPQNYFAANTSTGWIRIQ